MTKIVKCKVQNIIKHIIIWKHYQEALYIDPKIWKIIKMILTGHIKKYCFLKCINKQKWFISLKVQSHIRWFNTFWQGILFGFLLISCERAKDFPHDFTMWIPHWPTENCMIAQILFKLNWAGWWTAFNWKCCYCPFALLTHYLPI